MNILNAKLIVVNTHKRITSYKLDALNICIVRLIYTVVNEIEILYYYFVWLQIMCFSRNYHYLIFFLYSFDEQIFSNGRYKSVLHRVLVNSSKSRISVASLHSLPYSCKIQPSPNLINESNPKLYKDTDFATFLEYLSSCEHKSKSFLESRKLTN